MAPRRAVRIRLFTLLAVLVLSIALVACSDDGGGKGSSTSSGQAPITGVQWVLDTAALVRGAGDVTVTAQFTDSQVSGESGCNRYSASYSAKRGDRKHDDQDTSRDADRLHGRGE